jgi:CDP-diacylglycerol--glycerol-3-phosphate 3-phosphatidyltransferase
MASTETSNPTTIPTLKPIGRESLNLPNAITASRLVLAIILFVLIYMEAWWLTAAGLFVLAAGTDFLDGYLARKYGQVTTLGRILDPFVDKIIICGAFVFLLEKNAKFDSGVNSWMVIIVIGREMFITSLRGFLEQQGIDFSANWAGKIKMVLQCVAVTVALLSLSPYFRSDNFFLARDIILWLAVAVTAWSGITYVVRAARIIREYSQADPG